MKTTVAALVLLLMIVGTKTFAGNENGGGPRGGGQVVATTGGQLRFLDLVDASQIDSSRSRALRNQLPQTCRAQRYELLRDHLSQNVARIIDQKLNELSATSPLLAEILGNSTTRMLSKMILLPAIPRPLPSSWTDSQRVAAEIQTPVAFLNGGLIYVLEPIFNRLSDNDKAAAIVHESLRNLYFKINIQRNPWPWNTQAGNYTSPEVLVGIESFVRGLFLGGDLRSIIIEMPVFRKALQLSDSIESRSLDQLIALTRTDVESRHALQLIVTFGQDTRRIRSLYELLTELHGSGSAPSEVSDLRRLVMSPVASFIQNVYNSGDDRAIVNSGTVDIFGNFDCARLIRQLREQR